MGPGRVTESGTKIGVNVAVGERVLLPEYGGTTLTLGDEELSLFRDEDILGKFQVCAQGLMNCVKCYKYSTASVPFCWKTRRRCKQKLPPKKQSCARVLVSPWRL